MRELERENEKEEIKEKNNEEKNKFCGKIIYTVNTNIYN